MRVAALIVAAAAAVAANDAYGPARIVAELENPAIKESSGIASSRRWPGIYWTHNDSGDIARVFAFDRGGKDMGTFEVPGATNIDWEDIALGPGPRRGAWYLYIGETGGNKRKATEIVIYRVPEPAPRSRAVGKTEHAFPIRLKYPDHEHDAEAVLVHPQTGDLYIVTKAFAADPETIVFKAAAPHTKEVRTLERVAAIPFANQSAFTLMLGRVTGGDIAPDGRRAVLCDYFRAYEATLPPSASFDQIWTQEWKPVELAPRRQGEAICYRADGKALLATSEGVPCPLQEIDRIGP